MGIVTQRRRRQRAALVRRRMLAAAAGILLIGAAAALLLRERIALPTWSKQEESTQIVLTLPQRSAYALQLAVFDSGERAASEAARLAREGVRCVIWQREKMRIVVSTALSREGLMQEAAKGNEAYVLHDTLPEIALRLTGSERDTRAAQTLLEAPDQALMALFDGNVPLDTLVQDVRLAAEQAQHVQTEDALYPQLAQSLASWCTLAERAIQEMDEAQARNYAALTMYTLCREMRTALGNQALSAASTASAQRTPSTAADVMPPA